MLIQQKYIGIIGLTLALAGCSSEPRTVPYFDKNIEEARAVVSNTETCLGLDQTKVLTGTDECTNAHLALKKQAADEKNRKRKEDNDRAFEEGRFLPSVKN